MLQRAIVRKTISLNVRYRNACGKFNSRSDYHFKMGRPVSIVAMVIDLWWKRWISLHLKFEEPCCRFFIRFATLSIYYLVGQTNDATVSSVVNFNAATCSSKTSMVFRQSSYWSRIFNVVDPFCRICSFADSYTDKIDLPREMVAP